MLVQLIFWIFLGALAGWIASMIMNTDERMGAGANIVVGILGSLIGGFLVTLLTKGTASFTTAYSNLDIGSLVVSVLGAVVLLALMKMFRTQPA